MTDLKQLPDHCRLEESTDAARHDDERIRHEHKLVEAGEKGAVLVGLCNEGVHALLEGEFDANTNRPLDAIRICPRRAFIGRGHQSRTATCDDVASQADEFLGHIAHRGVDPVIFRDAGRPKNGDPVTLSPCRSQARQIANDIPQPDNRTRNKIENLALVT